jgi:NADH dehydrogenase
MTRNSELRVEVRTNGKVTEVTGEGITLADGSFIFIASELVVWAAGVKAAAILREVEGLEINRIDQLVVEPTLHTTRDLYVFAIGDCAALARLTHAGAAAGAGRASASPAHGTPDRTPNARQIAARLHLPRFRLTGFV